MAITFSMTSEASESNVPITFSITPEHPIAFNTSTPGSELNPYQGEYTVVPSADSATVLATKNKLMAEDVTVLKIPYYETTNPQAGFTVYIAGDL